jgi:hypothetical protein
VARSEVTVQHLYVDGATDQEEAHHINVDYLGGPNIEKGGVSRNSGRTKENEAHIEGRN